MILKIFAVRDSKVDAYNSPWFQRSHAEAERSFTALAQDKQTTVGQFPSDYDLYYLGTYDDQTGKIDPVDTPQHIVKAVNLIPQI